MLSVLLFAALVTAISAAFGVALLSLFDPAPPRFLAAALAGLAALCAGAALAGLAIPLGGPAARAGLLGGAAVVGFASRRALASALASWRSRAAALSRPALLAGSVMALAILGRAAGTVNVYDTGLYHAQAIRWAEEQPSAPGLGNLHVRLSRAPAWFPAAALFSWREQPPGPHRPLGSALALWIALASAAALDDLSRGAAGLRIVPAALGVAMLHVLFLSLSSPAPDVGAALLSWGAILLVLDADGLSRIRAADRAAVVAVAAAAPFVTPSAAPIALIAAFVLATAGGWRARAGLAVLGLAIATPFLARNAVSTGYPLYPVLRPSLDVDWRIPEALVRDDLEWARSWARVPGLPPEQVLAMPAREWVPRWWGALLLSDKALLAAAVLLLVPGAIRLRRSPGALLAAAACATALAVWISTAPDPRFVWGFLVPLPLLLGASFVPARRWPRAPLVAAGAVLALLARDTALLRAKGRDAGWGNLVVAATYPPDATHVAASAGMMLRVPDRGDQCWDAPIPCTPYPAQPVSRRRETLSGGFRHTPGAPIVTLPR